MSKDNKHTQGSPGDFEDKIDSAMAGLEADPDEEFHGADFYDEDDQESDFDSWEGEDDSDAEELAEQDSEEEYPEEEEYDQDDAELSSEEEDFWDEEETEFEEENSEEEGSESEDSEDDESADEPETSEKELQVEIIPPRSNKGRKHRRKDSAGAVAPDQPEKQTSKKSARPSPKPAARSARPTKISYVPITDEELDEKIIPVPRKKHKGLKVTGIVAAILAVTAGCAYGAVSYYYADRFFEGTYINGINCSNKTAYETEQLIASNVEDYSIEVTARNQEPQTISGNQINYRYVSDGEVLDLLKQQKPYEWIKGLYEQKSYTVSENTGYNRTQLQEQLKTLSCAQAENQTEPENAYVAYQNGQFVIVPETVGSKLNIKEAYKVLNAAVDAGQTSVNFSDTPEAYVNADVTQDDPALQSALEACNNYTKASITYTFGSQTTTLNGDTIKDWLQFDEKGQLIWDDNSFQQHVADYVAQLAATYDTVGTEREFQTTSGRTVYVSSSVYGWKIDQAAEAAQLSQEIQSGTQTTREPVYSQTANSYGVNDLGDTYIEVDLSEQHMYYYQNGSDIFESDFVSGNMSYADRQTHAGIFTLYYKKSPDVLRGTMKADGTYEYESEVQYWMPFDGGIGFHDASWRDEFGGDIYLTGGSHGCINLPPDNAAVLYDIIQYGVPIVCFY